MTEWWVRQHFGPRSRLALLHFVLVAGLTWVVWLIAENSFDWGTVFMSVSVGVGIAIGSLISDPFRDAFPPMTLRDEKLTVWRIVRDGGPVDNAADAPRVAHHAQWVLRRRPVVVIGAFAIVALSLLVFFGFVVNDDPVYARAAIILLVIVVVTTIPTVARIPKQRRNAERALTASRAVMPEHPAGNESARPGSPAGG